MSFINRVSNQQLTVYIKCIRTWKIKHVSYPKNARLIQMYATNKTVDGDTYA